MKRHLKIISVPVLILCLLTAASCGSAKSYDSASDYDSGELIYETTAAYSYSASADTYDAVSAEASVMASAYAGDEGADSSFVRTSQDKLIYTCSLSIETLDFQSTISAVQSLITRYGGFVESEEQTDSSSGVWYYEDYEKEYGTLREYIVIRIPTADYDAFLSELSGNGRVTRRSQNAENITTAYNDTVTTISSLKTQEERLIRMMDDAETVTEMLEIEDRLTEVQNELAIYENRLQTYDMDVAYSTITLTVEEVLEYTKDTSPVKTSTFPDRLKNALHDSWELFTGFLEGLLFFLIRALPILIVIGGLLFGIVILIRGCLRKSKRKRAVKAEKEQTE